MADTRVRVLIVDDEPLGIARVSKLLKSEPDAEVVGTAENGEDAILAIRELSPDLVFLDVQMPGKTGIDVVREIGADAMPATIFVTAYDQYAIQAFETAAVDYLMKPYDNERFAQAYRRARRVVELEGRDRLWDQLVTVLQAGGLPAAAIDPADPADPAVGERYLDRIAVQARGKTHLVPVAEIDYLMASREYVDLHTGSGKKVIRDSLQRLENRLDPARFMRIHRSVIVRLDAIEMILRGEGGDYEVQLKGGQRLRLSRYRREELERRLV